MELDRIILGDNQFFGINHMSEARAQEQAERFRDAEAILRAIDTAYESGVHAFMFTAHAKVADLCDYFRAHPGKYADLRLYPALPYAHKYASAVNEKGMMGAAQEFLFSGTTTRHALTTLLRGGRSVIRGDAIEMMRLLVDAEIRMFKGLNVQAIFLQNIVTDLLLGLRSKTILLEFASHVKSTYGVDPAFITMNMPRLVDFLLDCGIENPVVCSAINKIGYFMHPDAGSYERAIATRHFRPMAMSILASGAVPAREAIEYVAGLGVQSVVFGASSKSHIEETIALLTAAFHWNEQGASYGDPERPGNMYGAGVRNTGPRSFASGRPGGNRVRHPRAAGAQADQHYEF